MPLGDALVLIKDMLHALSSPDSPGFSRHAVNPTIKLLSAQRINKDGKEAAEDEVAARKFLGKTVFRMQCKPEMANQLGSMHGGCVATVVDNLTSVAVSGRQEEDERSACHLLIPSRPPPHPHRSTYTSPTSSPPPPGPSSA